MCLVGIDTDLIVYNAAAAAQHTYYKVYPKGCSEDESKLIERYDSAKDMKEALKQMGKKPEQFDVVPEIEVKEPYQAKLIADQIISKVYWATGATQSVMFLSDSKNFRHELATTQPYKDKRSPKPEHYQLVKDYLISHYNAVVVPDLEADDALGIFAEMCGNNDMPFVVASYDKDLKQIPGLHYDFRNDRLFHVSERESIEFFFKQVLTGDSTDTIPGLPGVGEVKAKKLLATCETYDDMQEVVKHAYINHTIGTKKNDDIRPMFDSAAAALQYLNEQANLVYIRRNRNIGVDFNG